MEQALYLRKTVPSVLIDDVAFELERGIALVSSISDGMLSDRFSREVYSYALDAAVDYLQRANQHLKDQIYTSTPAGSMGTGEQGQAQTAGGMANAAAPEQTGTGGQENEV